jgi:hypothetical protein
MPANNKRFAVMRGVNICEPRTTASRRGVMCKQKQHSPQMKKRCSDKNGFTFLGEIYRVRLLTFQQNILKIAVQTSCKPNYPTLNQTFQKVP